MPAPSPRFALNHMVAPRLTPAGLFDLARSLGLRHVEIRNDLGHPAGGEPNPAAVRAAAERVGVSIVSLNALQRFDEWNADREHEATLLAEQAAASGAGSLVLVPTNDGSGDGDARRQHRLRGALAALRPILAARGIVGLVEPLGFATSSLRLKRDAVEAMDAVGGDGFRLVHDTFHHALAGEREVWPERTGLVHVSGVSDPTVSPAQLLDSHRGLVDADDRLGNIAQIRALVGGDYAGLFSFEPFAPAVHALDDPRVALAASMEFIQARLREEKGDPV